MGRKKIARELRKVNVCMTLPPLTCDMLNQMAEVAGENQSQFVSRIIDEYYDGWVSVIKPDYSYKPFVYSGEENKEDGKD